MVRTGVGNDEILCHYDLELFHGLNPHYIYPQYIYVIYSIYSIFNNDLSASCACTLGQQPHVAL